MIILSTIPMLKRSYILKTFLFCMISFVLSGQVKNLDYSKLSYDVLKQDYYSQSTGNKEKLALAEMYLAKAKYEKENPRIVRGYYLLAITHSGVEDQKALKYLDNAIVLSKEKEDTIFPFAAYLEKGNLLRKHYQFKEALENYLLAQNSALKQNIDFYYLIKNTIALTKSEDLGELEEALQLYKESYRHYKTKNIRNPKYSWNYQHTLFGLADVYKSLGNTQLATYYNTIGFKEAQITKNKDFYALFILNEGANKIIGKNYQIALDSIDKAFPMLVGLEDKGNILAAFYYKGMANAGLGKTDLAVKNFKKLDSLYKETKRITPEFIDGYNYLIKYYKEKKDVKMQLYYLDEYFKIDSTIQKNYKDLYKLIQRKYDIPLLMKDREMTIQSLQNTNSRSYFWIIGLVTILMAVSGFGFFQYKQRKNYKERFEKIIAGNQQPAGNTVFGPKNEVAAETLSEKNKSTGISDEVIAQILNNLNDFEKNNGFLDASISIITLSQEFGTNSKYLSKIINIYKEKPFIQYVNDLRIDYAVRHLQEDKKARKFTLQALSNEYGFNNAESFSTAFFKKTGLKPSYFIKELHNV